MQLAPRAPPVPSEVHTSQCRLGVRSSDSDTPHAALPTGVTSPPPCLGDGHCSGEARRTAGVAAVAAAVAETSVAGSRTAIGAAKRVFTRSLLGVACIGGWDGESIIALPCCVERYVRDAPDSGDSRTAARGPRHIQWS